MKLIANSAGENVPNVPQADHVSQERRDQRREGQSSRIFITLCIGTGSRVRFENLERVPQFGLRSTRDRAVSPLDRVRRPSDPDDVLGLANDRSPSRRTGT